MTALLSTAVQTYEQWTLVARMNGKGGTKQVCNGRKEQKNGPKEPKERPKGGETKQSIKQIGSQLN
jgi:hypothetical protein